MMTDGTGEDFERFIDRQTVRSTRNIGKKGENIYEVQFNIRIVKCNECGNFHTCVETELN